MTEIRTDCPPIPIRLYVVPWLFPTWARAQAWWTVILVKRGVGLTERLVAHELAHVLQWRSLGVWRFLWRYARGYLRYGYAGHPLEVCRPPGRNRRLLPHLGPENFAP